MYTLDRHACKAMDLHRTSGHHNNNGYTQAPLMHPDKAESIVLTMVLVGIASVTTGQPAAQCHYTRTMQRSSCYMAIGCRQVRKKHVWEWDIKMHC